MSSLTYEYVKANGVRVYENSRADYFTRSLSYTKRNYVHCFNNGLEWVCVPCSIDGVVNPQWKYVMGMCDMGYFITDELYEMR